MIAQMSASPTPPQEPTAWKLAIKVPDVIEVPFDDVKNNVGYGQFIKQIYKQFIKPVMDARGIQSFSGALIEMFDGEVFPNRQPDVYFNDEMKWRLQTKKPCISAESVGKLASELGIDILKDRKTLEPVPHDPNAGYVAITPYKDICYFLYYNFQYNAPLVKEKLRRAREFLEAIQQLDVAEQPNVICYLVWSAMELVVEAILYSIPLIPKDKKIRSPHEQRMKRLTIMQEKIRALSTEFYSAFQAVSKDKNAARYADGATAQDQAALIKAVAVLANELEENRLLDEKEDVTPSDEAEK